MKKILNSIMLLCIAASSITFVGCKDDDDSGTSTNTDREFMTMFITDNTRGKGTSYPYNCGLDGAYPHGNTIHLYWYGVDDCAGCRLRSVVELKHGRKYKAPATCYWIPLLVPNSSIFC